MSKINVKGEMQNGVLFFRRILAANHSFANGHEYSVEYRVVVTGVLIQPCLRNMKCRRSDPEQGDPVEFAIWAVGDDEAKEYVKRRYGNAEGGNEYGNNKMEYILYRQVYNGSCDIEHD